MSNSDHPVTSVLPDSPVPPEERAAKFPATIKIGLRKDASKTKSSLAEATADELYKADSSDPDLPDGFSNTIQRLTSEDCKQILADILKAHMVKYGGEADKPMTPLVVCAGSSSSCGVSEKVQNSAGTLNPIMKTAVPAMIGAVAKTASDSLFDIVREPLIIPWAIPYVEVATVGGVVLICSAVVLMEKKPWLSKIMVKLGALAIAFSTLLPMTLALPPVMAVVFGLLVAVILVATATIV